MTAGSLRIGLLGGTLDPIHVGHLDAAEAARTALRLDTIVVIPSHDPPHRSVDPHASAFHRFAMVALAIDGRPEYRASDMELRRDGPSYTALTLRDWPTSRRGSTTRPFWMRASLPSCRGPARQRRKQLAVILMCSDGWAGTFTSSKRRPLRCRPLMCVLAWPPAHRSMDWCRRLSRGTSR
jgi:cytidyltransferase-like protein